MKISVIGLGYVGAVSCGCLPELGHEVIGVDTNPLKIKMINDGQSPVVEEGINELIDAAVKAGRLRATADVEDAIRNNNDALLGWYSDAPNGGEIGDIPMNEAGANLRSVMIEVTLGNGVIAPIQLMWSNAVGGPEGPFG